LSSRKDLTHLGDIVPKEMLVQEVYDLLPADECECGGLLPSVGDFGLLALEEINE